MIPFARDNDVCSLLVEHDTVVMRFPAVTTQRERAVPTLAVRSYACDIYAFPTSISVGV